MINFLLTQVFHIVIIDNDLFYFNPYRGYMSYSSFIDASCMMQSSFGRLAAQSFFFSIISLIALLLPVILVALARLI